jgi:hypothetical protein
MKKITSKSWLFILGFLATIGLYPHNAKASIQPLQISSNSPLYLQHANNILSQTGTMICQDDGGHFSHSSHESHSSHYSHYSGD